MSFELTLDSASERRTLVQFEQFPERLRAAIRQRLEGLTEELKARIEAREPEDKGKLRSETTSRIFNDPNKVVGAVFIEGGLPKAEYGKAAALEYGAHSTTTVRAHLERRTRIFGRFVAPMRVAIEQHSRRVNIEADRFLRGGIEEMREQVLDELHAAIEEALA
jgi:hypothetical protein